MASTYKKIASIATDGTTGTFTFSSIPQTYTHLVLIGEYVISTGLATASLTIGGQTSYSYESSTTNGNASPISGQNTTATSVPIVPSTASGTKNSLKIDFLYYSDSAKRPAFMSISTATTTDPSAYTITGRGDSLGAISQISLAIANVPTASTGLFTLYGVA